MYLFDRVGTVGIERDYSWPFVPIQAVCAHTDFQATEQPTQTENNPTDFCGGTETARLEDRGAVTWAASALDTKNDFSCKYTASLSRWCEPSKSHFRGKFIRYDIAIAARRRLLKFLWHQFHNFARNISPESRSPPRLLPRTPPSQAMAVSRGSCRGRVLWRPRMPHPMIAMPYYAISCTPIPPWSSCQENCCARTDSILLCGFDTVL